MRSTISRANAYVRMLLALRGEPLVQLIANERAPEGNGRVGNGARASLLDFEGRHVGASFALALELVMIEHRVFPDEALRNGVREVGAPVQAGVALRHREVTAFLDDNEIPGMRDRGLGVCGRTEQKVNQVLDDLPTAHVNERPILEERGVQGGERVRVDGGCLREVRLDGPRILSEGRSGAEDPDALRQAPGRRTG